MQLKLKRSQRTGMMGKQIFILDARIELGAEERALVNKYRLGSRVVYESTERQKHLANTQAHAEMTKGGPSMSAPPKAQALGAANTLYRMARAGISATRAALSLKTIDSLSRTRGRLNATRLLPSIMKSKPHMSRQYGLLMTS